MGRGNTQSKDPETEMSWVSWKKNKTRVAGALQAKGKVVPRPRFRRARSTMAKSVYFPPTPNEKSLEY